MSEEIHKIIKELNNKNFKIALKLCEEYSKIDLCMKGITKNYSRIIEKFPELQDSDYIKTHIGILGDKVGSGKSYVIYPSGKSKKISLFRNPKIYPGSDIFISFKLISVFGFTRNK